MAVRLPSVPELEGMGDTDRRRWYEAVKAGHPARVTWARVQAVVGGLLVAIVGLIPAAFMLLNAAALSVKASLHPGLRGGEAELMYLLTFGGLILVVAGIVLALLVARHLHRGALRRLIRETINGRRCPSCRYPLVGLPPSGGAMTCPECGMRTPVIEAASSDAAPP